MFELLPYNQIPNIKVPLLLGTQNNGMWSLHGVLTESSEFNFNRFSEVVEHLHVNRELYQNQTLFMLQWASDKARCVILLKPLYVQDADAAIEPIDASTLPSLSVGFFNEDDATQITNLFDGHLPFHENYPELMESIQPLVDTLLKFRP